MEGRAMMLRSLVAATALLATPIAAKDMKAGRWVDLTHAFNEKSVYWPTAEPFTKTTVTHGHTPGGWFYSAYNFAAAEHGGTHIDAPIHFAEGGRTVDQVPVGQLVGPAFVIDVSRQSQADVDYLVNVADIVKFEAEHGRIPEGGIVLLNTGRARLYGDPGAYMGTTERGADAVAKLHFPGLSTEGAALLVARKIAAVGIDTPSIDRGQSKDFAAHVELMTHNIPAFENVGDMSMLPPTGSKVIALPMKIEGGSGGPLRIVAHVPGKQ
jgi:kynurenine formamidase